ncbi:MAG: hypothetical protein GWN99_06875 [Gemmatimonadetes bacterium]|nr:hypothetical protein [Gemmatimonadota bacterium]NIS00786.1 hypothetical protein [Gemmatimonadota bacterium]NIW74838.1 hypothetical protein [Gemmatimonadota bacterium]
MQDEDVFTQGPQRVLVIGGDGVFFRGGDFNVGLCKIYYASYRGPAEGMEVSQLATTTCDEPITAVEPTFGRR